MRAKREGRSAQVGREMRVHSFDGRRGRLRSGGVGVYRGYLGGEGNGVAGVWYGARGHTHLH